MLRNIYILVDRTSVNSISLWFFGCSLIAKKLGFPRYVQIVLFGAVYVVVHKHDSSCVHVYVINANPLRSSMTDHLMKKYPEKKEKR